MYDGGKIVPGLLIFVGLMTFPIWHNIGSAHQMPQLEKPKDVKECVRPVPFMRTSHMKLLNEWRDDIIRDNGPRHGKTEGGVVYERSLMKGCLKCHDKKKKFCDQCHNYAAVKPYCWDCHYPPEEAI